MKRNKLPKNIKFKKADAILTGDWHLQDTKPVARKDNFYETQWNKLDFISDIQKIHKCPVLHSGDLFDYWKPSPMLLSKTMEHIPDDFHTIYGNHDLPQHNLNLAYKCGINVLKTAGKLKVLNYAHWGQKPDNYFEIKSKKILVWHVMTYQGKKPWPDCPDPKSARLLRKYSKYDLILTGHNHLTFVEKYEGRMLINPGSIFRLSTIQKGHKPCVYLWYADDNSVEPVYLPIEANVISREHLESVQKRNNRIDAFITGLNMDWNSRPSFENNMEKFKNKNNPKKKVMKIIYKALEY